METERTNGGGHEMENLYTSTHLPSIGLIILQVN